MGEVRPGFHAPRSGTALAEAWAQLLLFFPLDGDPLGRGPPLPSAGTL